MLKSVIIFILLLPMMLFASTKSDAIPSPKELLGLLDQDNFRHVGESTFSVLFWDIYRSKLLTTSGTYPVNTAEEQLFYEITYFIDISSIVLIKRTQEQWKYLGIALESYQPFIAELKTIWPDITKGDTLSLLIDNRISHFYFNQAYIGTINSPVFGQIFLDIWLAENTSEPGLRTQLLGGTQHD